MNPGIAKAQTELAYGITDLPDLVYYTSFTNITSDYKYHSTTGTCNTTDITAKNESTFPSGIDSFRFYFNDAANNIDTDLATIESDIDTMGYKAMEVHTYTHTPATGGSSSTTIYEPWWNSTSLYTSKFYINDNVYFSPFFLSFTVKFLNDTSYKLNSPAIVMYIRGYNGSGLEHIYFEFMPYYNTANPYTSPNFTAGTGINIIKPFTMETLPTTNLIEKNKYAEIALQYLPDKTTNVGKFLYYVNYTLVGTMEIDLSTIASADPTTYKNILKGYNSFFPELARSIHASQADFRISEVKYFNSNIKTDIPINYEINPATVTVGKIKQDTDVFNAKINTNKVSFDDDLINPATLKINKIFEDWDFQPLHLFVPKYLLQNTYLLQHGQIVVTAAPVVHELETLIDKLIAINNEIDWDGIGIYSQLTPTDYYPIRFEIDIEHKCHVEVTDLLFNHVLYLGSKRQFIYHHYTL